MKAHPGWFREAGMRNLSAIEAPSDPETVTRLVFLEGTHVRQTESWAAQAPGCSLLA